MDKIDYLRQNGVDIDTSLSNLIDIETYNELLDEFYTGLDEQYLNIKGFKDKCDMQNYSILVHAMKSNARTFGFNKLGDISYNHELKSKENDLNYVNEHFNEFESALNEVKTIINNYKKML